MEVAKELLGPNQVVFIRRSKLINNKGAFGTQPSGLYREVVSVQRLQRSFWDLTKWSVYGGGLNSKGSFVKCFL